MSLPQAIEVVKVFTQGRYAVVLKADQTREVIECGSKQDAVRVVDDIVRYELV